MGKVDRLLIWCQVDHLILPFNEIYINKESIEINLMREELEQLSVTRNWSKL